MDWQDGLSPAAKQRLARLGALTDTEKAAAADEAALEETLRQFFKNDIGGDELLSRLKAYEAAGKWGVLHTARERLQSSFKAADLGIEFTDGPHGSVTVSAGAPKPAPESLKDEVAVLVLTDATFDAAVRDHPLLVVDCWAVWCGPCRMVAPVVEELARDYAGRITFAKLDVDQNRATATRFAIQSIPTMLIFKNGRLVDQKLGAMPRALLEPAVTRHLDGAPASGTRQGQSPRP